MKKFEQILIFLFLTINLQISSTTLKCKFKIDPIGTFYSCFAQENQFLTQETEIIDGLHSENKSNNDVKGFLVNSNPNFYALPSVGKFFKNLIFINISRTKLHQITKKELKDFKKLKFLHLDNNQLTVIEPDLFIFNPKMQILSLKNNEISYIDPLVFDNLSELKILEINGNNCASDLQNEVKKFQIIEKIKNLQCYNRRSLLKHYEEMIKNFNNIEIKKNISNDTLKMMSCVGELKNMNLTLQECSASRFRLESLLINCSKNLNENKTENDELKNEIRVLTVENKNLKTKNNSFNSHSDDLNDTSSIFIEWNEFKITRFEFFVGATSFISISLTLIIITKKICKSKNESKKVPIEQGMKTNWECAEISLPVRIEEQIYDEPCVEISI